MGIRTCPLCGVKPTVERLCGTWYGYRYTWRVVDKCGRHTTYDYSQRAALYTYRQSCAYSDTLIANEAKAKHIVHEASSIPWYIRWWKVLTVGRA